MTYSAQLEFLLTRAQDAAAIMRRNYRGDFKVYIKPDGSKVTDVDLEISKMWQVALAREMPQIALYSEESDNKLIVPGLDYFIVDELDGTSYFVDGQPGFTHQSAFFSAEKGLMIGVIAYPLDDIILYAVRGEGVFISKQGSVELVVPTAAKTRESLIFGYPERYKGDKYSNLYDKMGVPPHRIIRTDARRTLQMVKGELDVNIFLLPRIEAWDWAGEKVIIECLGFNHSFLNGQPISFGQNPPAGNPGYLLCPKSHADWLSEPWL
jgi:fructose-1,6-bisphosphatase/inositol monophosphatase family enzyme